MILITSAQSYRQSFKFSDNNSMLFSIDVILALHIEAIKLHAGD